MHPLSDKDLDRLSREAAEQYDVEQNTSGWEKLEQKLNKHLPETGKKERRRFLFFLWLLALLCGGGLLWMLTANNGPQLITLKQGSLKPTLPVTNGESDQLPVKKNPNPTRTKSNDVVTEQSEAASDIQTRQRDPEVPVKDKTTSVPAEMKITSNNAAVRPRKSDLKKSFDEVLSKDGTKQTRKKNPNLNLSGESAVPSNVDASNKVEDEKRTTAKNTDSDDQTEGKTPESSSPPPSPIAPIAHEDQKVLADSGDQKVLADSIREPTIPKEKNHGPDSASAARKAASPIRKGQFKKGLEIGVVGAPDMSNVKFSNTDEVGFIAGIQLGYRLSQRWSVNTGVLYTRKNYTARGKDFAAPKGTWMDNVILNEVEGSCFMYDIPLNVRYDLNASNRHRFFVSTGLSTYFMKKENYDYYYQYANGSPGHRYRSYPSTERHWFSILNLSGGFEKKISKWFSIQAEPYLKIPLTGVGYGNIELSSYGIYFSLKFGR